MTLGVFGNRWSNASDSNPPEGNTKPPWGKLVVYLVNRKPNKARIYKRVQMKYLGLGVAGAGSLSILHMVVQKERNLYVQGLEAKVTSKTEIEEVLAWHTHKGTIEKIM